MLGLWHFQLWQRELAFVQLIVSQTSLALSRAVSLSPFVVCQPMAFRLPKRIKIAIDDYKAKRIGKLADGRQFFMTTPFVPGGHEYYALYLFTADGEFEEAIIDDFGPRGTTDAETQKEVFFKRLDEIGDKKYCSIKVEPFSIERDGVEFGLVPRAPEEKGQRWWVEAQPGNYMAFTSPWNGSYDT